MAQTSGSGHRSPSDSIDEVLVSSSRDQNARFGLSINTDIDASSLPTPPSTAHTSGSSSVLAIDHALRHQRSVLPSMTSTAVPSVASTPMRSSEDLIKTKKGPTVSVEEVNTEYRITRLSDQDDDGRITGWQNFCYYLSPIFAILTLGTYWTYFVLRIIFVLAAQDKQGQPLYMAWTFVGIEICVAIPIFFQMFWSVFIWKKRSRPRLRLLGDSTNVPTVDVLITCCKEEIDVIMDTAIAACNLDYPVDRFRVWILDDGKDAELEAAVNRAKEQYGLAHFFYRARTKIPGQPHHFKAGNLNYGITETLKTPDCSGPGELFACLDADMIPEPHWLRATIPHLLVNDKVALACPPQLFYNIPKGDPLAQSLDFFVHLSEPVKDALGVAWCTGSGYVVRREALAEINNIPVGGLAEDVETSTLLLGKGWKTAYVHEPLQFGTVPNDFSSHLKQRTRWAIGTVNTSLTLRFCLWGEKVRQMKFWPRLSGFIYSVTAMFSLILLISLFALPIVLISGKPLIAYATDAQLNLLIWMAFIVTVVGKIGELVMFAPAGYTNGQRGARSQIWMAPYFGVSMIRSFILPSWAGGQAHSFKPTGSLKSEINEREDNLRAPLWRRLYVVTVNYLVGMHFGYIYLILICITVATSRCIFRPPANLFQPLSANTTAAFTLEFEKQNFSRAQFQCLLTHAYWPPLSWLTVVAAFWQPIGYMISPPSMPPREDLLNRDPKTGVARAKDDYKDGGWSGSEVFFEIWNVVGIVFTIIIFALTFTWL